MPLDCAANTFIPEPQTRCSPLEHSGRGAAPQGPPSALNVRKEPRQNMQMLYVMVGLLLGLIGGVLVQRAVGHRQQAEIDDRLQREAQAEAQQIRAEAQRQAREMHEAAEQDRQDATRKMQDAARQVPLSRLLVETDAPFLAPVPKRGKPNRPGRSGTDA